MKQQQIKQLSTELKIEDVDKESFIKALDVISKDEKEMKKNIFNIKMSSNIFKSLKRVLNFHKDMVVYLQKEEKQKHQLEQLQIQIHQLSGKLDDTKKFMKWVNFKINY